MSDRKRILFLCSGNFAQSLMAEGLLREYAGDEFEISAAAINPHPVPPEAVDVMKDMGIDISGRRLMWAEQVREQEFDYVFAIDPRSARAYMPFGGRAEWISWDLDDFPAFRERRYDLKTYYHWRRGDIAKLLLKWLHERGMWN